jgi:hypothetical protein
MESKISRRILKLEILKAQHYEQIHKEELHFVFEYNMRKFIKNIKSDGWRRSNIFGIFVY